MKDDGQNPLLGVQLVTKGSDLDFFVQFRDHLRGDPSLLSSYNDLKRRFAGRTMDACRRAKADFIRRALL